MKSWLILLAGLQLFWHGCGLGNAQNFSKEVTQAAKKKDWQSVQELAEKRIHSVPTETRRLSC